jgi:hypothetical protein
MIEPYSVVNSMSFLRSFFLTPSPMIGLQEYMQIQTKNKLISNLWVFVKKGGQANFVISFVLP